jgi:hypothetical protein
MPVRIEILRPDDLLALTIDAHNLALDFTHAAGPRLVRVSRGTPAYLVVIFPPQAFAEEALWEGDGTGATDPPLPAGDVRSAIAGPTRLAFRVPDSITSIAYTLSGLLDWSRLLPSLSRAAQIVGQPSRLNAPPPVTEPASTETGIELPYRLVISPGPAARWRHSTVPIVSNGRTELWHTRLVIPDPANQAGGLVELGPNAEADIRAVWSPDQDVRPAPPTLPKVHTPLKASHRRALVRLTSTFPSLIARRTDLGKPARSRRLTLSALGGSIEVYGSWPDKPADLTLAEWEHRATLGRDFYVKVVELGRLFPFQHRAARLTITERRFEMSPAGATGASPTAYLRQYQLITPIDRELSYPRGSFAHYGREMPLMKVRINTVVTPKLDPPQIIPGTAESHVVRVGNAAFPFSMTGTDIKSNAVDFTAGLIFIADSDNPGKLDAVAAHYKGLDEAQRAGSVANQKVVFAEPEQGTETTTFVVSAFHFDAQPGGPAGFRPVLAATDVRVPALEAINGASVNTRIAFFQDYLDHDFDPITGVFAEVTAGKLPVSFAAEQTGGFVRPDLSVRGFARGVGPVAGNLTQARAGRLDAAEAFESTDARLFGALALKDIIASNRIREVSPSITTVRAPTIAPTALVTTLRWNLTPQRREAGPLKFEPLGTSRLAIDASVRQPLSATEPAKTRVAGTLNDFTIELTGVVRLSVQEFAFASSSGELTSVRMALVDNEPIAFRGALNFLHKLARALPPGIFGDNGPRITVAPDHVCVGFSISLPPAALGVFTLRHVAVSTALRLPFLSGRPSLSIAFASREKPFELAVVLLGGAGFVRVETDTEQVRVVEAMLEFGGLFAYDVGVASGSVHSMTGIYVALRAGASELTGFVSVGGEMTILCVVSASVEFNLSLTYYEAGPVVKGAATVSLSVRIAFISKSVSFTVEKSFSAGSEHISIAKLMTPADWSAYAGAFA